MDGSLCGSKFGKCDATTTRLTASAGAAQDVGAENQFDTAASTQDHTCPCASSSCSATAGARIAFRSSVQSKLARSIKAQPLTGPISTGMFNISSKIHKFKPVLSISVTSVVNTYWPTLLRLEEWTLMPMVALCPRLSRLMNRFVFFTNEMA